MDCMHIVWGHEYQTSMHMVLAKGNNYVLLWSLYWNGKTIHLFPKKILSYQGRFRGGVRGVRPPKIRKAYVIQR